jgi:hypothetical protein
MKGIGESLSCARERMSAKIPINAAIMYKLFNINGD